MTVEPIGTVRTDFPEKFGLPRQSGTPGLSGRVEFFAPFDREEAFRGLDGYSHVWLVWGFDRSGPQEEFSPTVRPPRLGGNERVGVFASRAPYRPNGLALSAVRLKGINREGGKVSLDVDGIDMADGTPVYDVKPYVPASDSVPEAAGGYASERAGHSLTVRGLEKLEAVPAEKRAGLESALAQDPRPAYQEEGRTYGFLYAGFEISFTVAGGVLTVEKVSPARPGRRSPARG